MNTVDFFNEINLLYGVVAEFCTDKACPVMCAGPKYEYMWADGQTVKRPMAVSAPRYVEPGATRPRTCAIQSRCAACRAEPGVIPDRRCPLLGPVARRAGPWPSSERPGNLLTYLDDTVI